MATGLLDKYFTNMNVNSEWQQRIDNVLASADHHNIARVSGAGEVKKGKQTMHNGLKINVGSYYGPEIMQMLIKSKGVHEPQEEYVFQEVLKKMPDGATMLELGAYWSFYSMWFNQKVKNAINFMVEPEPFNLKQGKANFKLNNMKGTFIEGFIGKEEINKKDFKQLTVDGIVASNNIKHLNILHSDIQGFEFDMLEGAKETIQSGKVDYIFISTHNVEVHEKCKQQLAAYNFTLLAEADMEHTYSEDGLLVACRNNLTDALSPMAISQR
jgi:hypothetical protein